MRLAQGHNAVPLARPSISSQALYHSATQKYLLTKSKLILENLVSDQRQTFFKIILCFPGLSCKLGDLGEAASIIWLTIIKSPYFQLREKFKCINFKGEFKF